MDHPDPVDPGLGPRPLQRRRDVGGPHRCPPQPGDDVPGIVIKHRRQGVPAPADDLPVRELGLPERMRPPGRMPKRRGRRQHDGVIQTQAVLVAARQAGAPRLVLGFRASSHA